jgi:putative ABC transport system permease protein
MSSLYIFLWTSVKIALRQLLRHKVRSMLTMLGIIIGVGGVVAIVSLGEGLRSLFMRNIASQSATDIVYVMPDTPMRHGMWVPTQKPFRNRDVEMILTSEYVASVVAGNLLEGAIVKHGWRSERVLCQIVPHEYFPVDQWKLGRGRYYTTPEEHGRASLCVVGSDIPKDLFDEGEDALGSDLTINGVRFTVIGIMKSRTAMEGGQQSNTMVFVPLQTGQARLTGNDDIFWMAIKLREGASILQAKDDIGARLRASRRIRSGADDDFKISTTEDWAKFANKIVNTLIMVLGIVAVIALIVGGIGVMNIMLVSVRERTREIGLRKALGATSAYITWQFLVEATTLTVVGGLGGLVLGYAMGGGVALLMKAAWDFGWVPQVPASWIIIVFLTCIGLGLAFGVYPAYRAGQLDPINALRYE